MEKRIGNLVPDRAPQSPIPPEAKHLQGSYYLEAVLRVPLKYQPAKQACTKPGANSIYSGLSEAAFY